MAKTAISRKALEENCIDILVVRSRVVTVTLKGQNPVLFNKLSNDMSKAKGEQKTSIREDPIEKERRMWREKLHYRDDIGVYWPGINLQNCIASGAQYWGQKIPGSMKTYTDLVKSAMICEDMPLGIMDINDPRIEQFGTYATGNVSRGSRGGKVWKIRPMIREWGGSFIINVFDDRLTEGVLRTIITFAGVFRGLGDWRPRYGRFSLEHFEEKEAIIYE